MMMTTEQMIEWLNTITSVGGKPALIAARLREQDAELAKMRPIVEAARAWRREPSSRGDDVLNNALDAYERAIASATLAASRICERFGLDRAAVEGVAEEIERAFGEEKV